VTGPDPDIENLLERDPRVAYDVMPGIGRSTVLDQERYRRPLRYNRADSAVVTDGSAVRVGL
jgi:hypothetical protein